MTTIDTATITQYLLSVECVPRTMVRVNDALSLTAHEICEAGTSIISIFTKALGRFNTSVGTECSVAAKGRKLWCPGT